jgi:hypothetical protein
MNQNNSGQQNTINKISKVCWNENGWKYPSGRLGKSKSKESCEYLYGYGHEEWIFDLDRQINGFHYSFLQTVGKHRDKYTGQKFNISLYSLNSENRIQYYIAEIKNVFVIDRKEENEIHEEYRRRDWLNEMYEQLKVVNADVANFKENENRALFNIRFEIKDVHWHDEKPIPIPPAERIRANYYNLLNRQQDLFHNIESVDDNIQFKKVLLKSTNPITRTTIAGDNEYSCLHNEIQNSFFEYLKGQYPDAQNIGLECFVGRNKVDVALREKNSALTIFEVKTYKGVKQSIRFALGQLLEYSHFPNNCRAISLKIVSHAPLNDNTRNYLHHLRKLYSLPIGYIQFDYNKKVIIEEV